MAKALNNQLGQSSIKKKATFFSKGDSNSALVIEQESLQALEKEYFSLRMLYASKQLKETHKLRDVRRNIARQKTKMRLLNE